MGSNLAVRAFIATNQVNWHNRFGHAPEKSITQTILLVKEVYKRFQHLTVDFEVF